MPTPEVTADVVGIILTHTDRPTIRTVSLCSVAFREAALPFLYHKLSFSLDDSIRLRAHVSDGALRCIKALHLRIDELSKAIYRNGEPAHAGPGNLTIALEAVRVENSFPVRLRTYEAFKSIISACPNLSRMQVKVTGGWADLCDTTFYKGYFQIAVAKCVGAAVDARPSILLSVHLSSPWPSLPVSCTNVWTYHNWHVVDFQIRASTITLHLLRVVSRNLQELKTFKLDYCDVRDAIDWVPGGFGALKNLRLSYNTTTLDQVSQTIYTNILACTALRLQELEINVTSARFESPDQDICRNLLSLPRLRSLVAYGDTIYALLRKGALPKIQHIGILQARHRIFPANDDIPKPENVFLPTLPIIRALQQHALATLQSIHLDDCSSDYLEAFLQQCPSIDSYAGRLTVRDNADLAQKSLACCAHLSFVKAMEAADVAGFIGFTSSMLELVEFADERGENQTFLKKVDAPKLRQVTVKDDFEY